MKRYEYGTLVLTPETGKWFLVNGNTIVLKGVALNLPRILNITGEQGWRLITKLDNEMNTFILERQVRRA